MDYCDYGCGKEAKNQLKNGKWCCSKSCQLCSGVIEKKRQTCLNKYGVDNPSKLKEVKEKKKQTSLKNYRVDHPNKSQEIKEKKKQIFLEKHGVDNPSKLPEIQEKIKQTWLKNYRVDHPSKSQEIQEKKKQTLLNKYDTHPNKLTIDKINERYPFFSQIEEMRYNPDKPQEYEIQVHCKYRHCKNSKEMGGWFSPTKIQLSERIRQVEKEDGNGGSYFYCSEKCKFSCPLYNLQSDPFKDNELPYTQEEYSLWKQTVLENDNYQCQICELTDDLHCHHIQPVKTHPHLALDPSNGIVLCKTCHYKYGHNGECSTGKLANKICHDKRIELSPP